MSDQLAILIATDKITRPQYIAGEAFADLAKKYLDSIGVPIGFSGDARSDELPPQGRCLLFKEKYLEAREKLEALGPQVRISVENIAIYESPPVDEWDLDALRIGLSALI